MLNFGITFNTIALLDDQSGIRITYDIQAAWKGTIQSRMNDADTVDLSAILTHSDTTGTGDIYDANIYGRLLFTNLDDTPSQYPEDRTSIQVAAYNNDEGVSAGIEFQDIHEILEDSRSEVVEFALEGTSSIASLEAPELLPVTFSSQWDSVGRLASFYLRGVPAGENNYLPIDNEIVGDTFWEEVQNADGTPYQLVLNHTDLSSGATAPECTFMLNGSQVNGVTQNAVVYFCRERNLFAVPLDYRFDTDRGIRTGEGGGGGFIAETSQLVSTDRGVNPGGLAQRASALNRWVIMRRFTNHPNPSQPPRAGEHTNGAAETDLNNKWFILSLIHI